MFLSICCTGDEKVSKTRNQSVYSSHHASEKIPERHDKILGLLLNLSASVHKKLFSSLRLDRQSKSRSDDTDRDDKGTKQDPVPGVLINECVKVYLLRRVLDSGRCSGYDFQSRSGCQDTRDSYRSDCMDLVKSSGDVLSDWRRWRKCQCFTEVE